MEELRERRHYPKDLDGSKNEWKALVKHYEEYDLKANMLEKYSKNVVQETMRYARLDQERFTGAESRVPKQEETREGKVPCISPASSTTRDSCLRKNSRERKSSLKKKRLQSESCSRY